MLHRRDEQCSDWLCSKCVVQASVWRVLLRLRAGPGLSVPLLWYRSSGRTFMLCISFRVVQTAGWECGISAAWLALVPVHRLVLVILLSCFCASCRTQLRSAEILQGNETENNQGEWGGVFCLLPPFHFKHGGKSGPQRLESSRVFHPTSGAAPRWGTGGWTENLD